MRVGNLMSREPKTVDATDNLVRAAQIMRVHDLGFLPVRRGERVLGVVTDRDLTVRAAAEGLDPLQTPVERVMTGELAYCFEDESPTLALELMEDRGVRRLLVLDRKMHLVGVLSLGDLTALPGAEPRVGELLEHLT